MKSAEHPRGDVLQAFFDGELPSAEAARIQEHCAGCPACSRALNEIESVVRVLARDKALLIAPTVWPRIVAVRQRGQRRVWTPATAFGAAAVCAVGILLGILAGAPGSTETAAQSEATRISEGRLWSGDQGTSLLGVYSAARTKEWMGES